VKLDTVIFSISKVYLLRKGIISWIVPPCAVNKSQNTTYSSRQIILRNSLDDIEGVPKNDLQSECSYTTTTYEPFYPVSHFELYTAFTYIRILTASAQATGEGGASWIGF